MWILCRIFLSRISCPAKLCRIFMSCIFYHVILCCIFLFRNIMFHIFSVPNALYCESFGFNAALRYHKSVIISCCYFRKMYTACLAEFPFYALEVCLYRRRWETKEFLFVFLACLIWLWLLMNLTLLCFTTFITQEVSASDNSGTLRPNSLIFVTMSEHHHHHHYRFIM